MGRSNIFIEFDQLSGTQLILREVKGPQAGKCDVDLEMYRACRWVAGIGRNQRRRGGTICVGESRRVGIRRAT